MVATRVRFPGGLYLNFNEKKDNEMDEKMTLKQRDMDYQTMSKEDWKKKWMAPDGGFIIPIDCQADIKKMIEKTKEGK